MTWKPTDETTKIAAHQYLVTINRMRIMSQEEEAMTDEKFNTLVFEEAIASALRAIQPMIVAEALEEVARVAAHWGSIGPEAIRALIPKPQPDADRSVA